MNLGLSLEDRYKIDPDFIALANPNFLLCLYYSGKAYIARPGKILDILIIIFLALVLQQEYEEIVFRGMIF